MTKLKDQMLRSIERHTAAKAADLAGEFVRAAPEEKEVILAGLDFERWLEHACQECRAGERSVNMGKHSHSHSGSDLGFYARSLNHFFLLSPYI